MTGWDATEYLRFEKERTRPAIDLLAQIPDENPRTCVDIGCGPGNSTELLVNRFPGACITGLDQSSSMLAAARVRLPHINFEQINVTHWEPDAAYDVIFASASLQWLPDHEAFFPRLASWLAVGGWLAVQMPDTLQDPSRALLRMVAAEGRWTAKLMPVITSRPRIRSIKAYYGLLASLCAPINIWHTTYFYPLDNATQIVEWMKGANHLEPFLAKLDGHQCRQFLEQYGAQICAAYPSQTDGKVLLPFPTLFIAARRSV